MYRDFLWCLSTTGTVYRFSLFDDKADYIGTMGAGFGQTPFAITEVMSDVSVKDWSPFLISINKGSLAGINLLTGAAKQFLIVEFDERILSSFENQFSTIVADGRSACFLKRKGTETYLSICDLSTAKYVDYELGDRIVAGPFKLENSIGVYFENALDVLGPNGLKEYALPRNFKSLMSADTGKDLRLPLGRMPFMLDGKSIYIPGRQETLGSSSEERSELEGFLFFTLKGNDPSHNFISAEGVMSYGQSSAGHPVVIRNGKISCYRDAGPTLLVEDEQLVARGPAFYENDLKIGFVNRGGGGFCLRSFQGEDVFDYPLANLPDFLVPGGFYLTNGRLAFVYRTRQNFMRFVVWGTYAG
ncbi:MAG TPA: hypothetical protein VNG71_15305 [Pyrinomonadaceae bacterium]|nr:hypothetical protein [Pyrinomonadaceae bacterium]